MTNIILILFGLCIAKRSKLPDTPWLLGFRKWGCKHIGYIPATFLGPPGAETSK